MHRKVAATIMGVMLITLCSGASCRQETAQNVLSTFLITLAETTAEQLVTTTTAKPLGWTGDVDSTAGEV